MIKLTWGDFKNDEFKKNENKFAKWAIGWDAVDNAICVAAKREYVKLSRIKRERS